jgi:hypothetical protein
LEFGGVQIEQGKHVLVEVGAWQIDKTLEDNDPDLLIALVPDLDKTDKANPLATPGGEVLQVDRLARAVITKPFRTQSPLEFKPKELLGLGIEVNVCFAQSFSVNVRLCPSMWGLVYER